MNINGINMVQVMLNLAVNMLKLGNKAVQELQMMHQSQGIGDPFG